MSEIRSQPIIRDMPSALNEVKRKGPQEKEALLRERLQAIVPRICGTSSPITAIHRGRSEYSSSYECAIISVQLANGRQFKVFLKDFGFSHIPRREPQQRRERELRVYRDLLA